MFKNHSPKLPFFILHQSYNDPHKSQPDLGLNVVLLLFRFINFGYVT